MVFDISLIIVTFLSIVMVANHWYINPNTR